MNVMKAFCSVGFIWKFISNQFTMDARLTKKVFGLNFKNPIGLGAGFDKNAKYLRELEALGFGFVEIGTVTPQPQAGNEKPRLFRLPKDLALINRMGFNNDGMEVITERLKSWRNWQFTISNKQIKNAANSQFPIHHSRLIIGGNIGKNKNTPNENAWRDYELCFDALHPYVDFFVVNVSSPNTPGLRELQEKDALRKILTHLQVRNTKYKIQRPILLKIAPDLSWSQIDDVIHLAKEIKLDGLVATNTTMNREFMSTNTDQLQNIGNGGVSGKPLSNRSTEIITYIHKSSGGALPIVGSGGIFTAEDANEKFMAGASLAEVWTGFIYEGPFIVRKICKGLKT